jgi:hypothetical protein
MSIDLFAGTLNGRRIVALNMAGRRDRAPAANSIHAT